MVDDLQVRGWPVTTLDCTTDRPERIAARIMCLIEQVLAEKGVSCP
jgi:dTMP kinase